MLKQQLAELQQQVEVAKLVDKQCTAWADEGMIKQVGENQLEIVDDPQERLLLRASRMKEQQIKNQEANLGGENLMERFENEAEDGDY